MFSEIPDTFQIGLRVSSPCLWLPQILPALQVQLVYRSEPQAVLSQIENIWIWQLAAWKRRCYWFPPWGASPMEGGWGKRRDSSVWSPNSC